MIQVLLAGNMSQELAPPERAPEAPAGGLRGGGVDHSVVAHQVRVGAGIGLRSRRKKSEERPSWFVGSRMADGGRITQSRTPLFSYLCSR